VEEGSRLADNPAQYAHCMFGSYSICIVFTVQHKVKKTKS
jgi:hypothetical protein